MDGPFTVRISCLDSASGKEFQLFEQKELTYEALVATQEVLSNALVGLGKAGIELRKAKGNPKPA